MEELKSLDDELFRSISNKTLMSTQLAKIIDRALIIRAQTQQSLPAIAPSDPTTVLGIINSMKCFNGVQSLGACSETKRIHLEVEMGMYIAHGTSVFYKSAFNN